MWVAKLQLIIVLLGAKIHPSRAYTPNDFDSNGVECWRLRPSHTVVCPPYCVKTRNADGSLRSQKQLQDACYTTCDGNMLQDGQCVSTTDTSICPADSSLQQDTNSGMWSCVNSSGGVTKTFENPCSCSNLDLTSTHQACSRAKANQTIEHYNLVDDRSPPMGLTMQSCSPNPTKYQVLNGDPRSPITEGFLQCPVEGLDVFKPTHFHMWYLSIFYFLPLAIICSYAAYKHYKESKLDKSLIVYHSSQSVPAPPVYVGSPRSQQEKKVISIERQDTGLDPSGAQAFGDSPSSPLTVHNMTQAGLKNSRVGRVAFVSLIAVSVGTVAVLILQIVDVYGLVGHAFCAEEMQACLSKLGDGQSSYSWREGFKCTAHCLFGDEWSTGQSPYWPYSRGAGGGRIYLLIFLLFWMFAVELFLVLRLFRSVIRTWFLLRCPLDQATMIRVTLPKKIDSTADFNIHSRAYQLTKYTEKMKTRIFGPSLVTKICRIHEESDIRYFVFQSERYVWKPTEFKFEKSVVSLGRDIPTLCAQIDGLSTAEGQRRLTMLGLNQVEIKMPSIARSIFDETFRIESMYQILCLLVWYEFYYWLAASIVLSVVIISNVLSIHCKRSSRRRLVALAMSHKVVSCKRDGQLKQLGSQFLTVGDVVLLERDLEVPCDMILLTGSIVVDEACLTGEPEPITKSALQNEPRIFDPMDMDIKSCVFAGSRVVAASEGEPPYALVTAVSTNTMRGALLKELLIPTQFLFEFYKHWTIVFMILLIWGILNVFVGVALIDWELEGWYYGIFTISQTISPLIPAVFVASQSVTARRLNRREIHCAVLPRTIVSAKIKHVCFDKTGTLTSPGLALDSVTSYDDGSLIIASASECPPRLLWGLATCHELQLKGPEVVGVEVDVRMFEWTGFTLHGPEAQNQWKITSPRGETRTVLKRYGFQRTSMCASVIVDSDVYVKGSWETIIARCQFVPPAASNDAANLQRQGYYLLAIAYKSIGPHASGLSREQVECDLTFLGLIAFKNDLVPDAVETLTTLRNARLNSVMITGDSMLTAVKAAQDCLMLDPHKVVLMGDADTARTVTWRNADDLSPVEDRFLRENTEDNSIEIAITGNAFEVLKRAPDVDLYTLILTKVKVFARMNPSQKVEVVNYFMKNGITAMIGDGTNDAAALKAAHVGMAMRSGADTGSREATVVAHFSCSEKKPSLEAVTTLIKMGRCGMASTMAAYKNLIIYGQITVMVSFLEMWLRVVPAEAYWITVDAAVNSLMTWGILSSAPAPTLSPKLPSTSLFSVTVAYSVVGQIFTNWIWMLTVILLLIHSDWIKCKQFDSRLLDHAQWWTKSDNYEAATLGLYALFQWISSAPVVSFGNGFRAKWIKAWRVHIIWLVLMGFILAILFSTGRAIPCMFRTNCGDASLLNAWHKFGLRDGIVKHSVPSEGTLFIPPGCPCESDDCELEHMETCTKPHYNSAFHHNIFPISWRITLLAAMLANLLCNYVLEWLILRRDNMKYPYIKTEPTSLTDPDEVAE